MNDRHKSFNEEALFNRKKTFMGYRFCPWCGKPLQQQQHDGLTRMACADESCGFIFYQNPVPAAGAIIVENDHILLVERAHPPKIGDWTIPAGFMEWDEHPEQTAVRELEEETGLKIELTSFFEVYSGSDDCRSNAILILYLARRVGGTLIAGDDASRAEFFPFDSVPRNIAFEAHRHALRDYNERYRKNRQ